MFILHWITFQVKFYRMYCFDHFVLTKIEKQSSNLEKYDNYKKKVGDKLNIIFNIFNMISLIFRHFSNYSNYSLRDIKCEFSFMNM